MTTAGDAFCSERTSFVTAVTVAWTALSGLPEGTAMLAVATVVPPSDGDALEDWLEPAWQAAAKGRMTQRSRVSRRGMARGGLSDGTELLESRAD